MAERLELPAFVVERARSLLDENTRQVGPFTSHFYFRPKHSVGRLFYGVSASRSGGEDPTGCYYGRFTQGEILQRGSEAAASLG